MDNMSKLVTTIRNTIMTTVPDVLPGEAVNDQAWTQSGKKKKLKKEEHSVLCGCSAF